MAHSIEVEIERNFAAFIDMLAQLLPDSEGKYALLRNQTLYGTFPSAGEAEKAGFAKFEDQPYSIQLVSNELADLGFQSYAVREGQSSEQ